MSRGTVVRVQGYPHSYTRVAAADGWVAFAAACEGGGSPPEWTQQGPDPAVWTPPVDAAGSLWTERLGEPPAELLQSFEPALCADTVFHAAYFSSGGQGVFLVSVQGCPEDRYVYVFRGEPTPRLGERERNLSRIGLCPQVW
jgi:hypothetical protein